MAYRPTIRVSGRAGSSPGPTTVGNGHRGSASRNDSGGSRGRIGHSAGCVRWGATERGRRRRCLAGWPRPTPRQAPAGTQQAPSSWIRWSRTFTCRSVPTPRPSWEHITSCRERLPCPGSRRRCGTASESPRTMSLRSRSPAACSWRTWTSHASKTPSRPRASSARSRAPCWTRGGMGSRLLTRWARPTPLAAIGSPRCAAPRPIHSTGRNDPEGNSTQARASAEVCPHGAGGAIDRGIFAAGLLRDLALFVRRRASP